MAPILVRSQTGWMICASGISEFRWQKDFSPEDESQYNQLHHFKTRSLFMLARLKVSLQRSCRQCLDKRPVTTLGF